MFRLTDVGTGISVPTSVIAAMIPFSLFTAYQFLSPGMIVSAPENENATVSIMCVLTALLLHDGNDRDELFFVYCVSNFEC